jgi:hypothetical protein
MIPVHQMLGKNIVPVTDNFLQLVAVFFIYYLEEDNLCSRNFVGSKENMWFKERTNTGQRDKIA